jgi:hypothetical protein
MAPATRKPNFFIVGAPKSGTTAMADYLRAHPQVFFSDPKEPFFWCDDLPALRRRERIENLDAYLRLFAGAGSEHLAVGEGSTLYLSSETAVANILSFDPGARLVVMLRHPVDMAHAFHMQMVFQFYEDQSDFETAWKLQDERRRGRHVPSRCLAPELLQYRRIAQTGRQIERLLEVAPRDQVRWIFFDDFRERPREAYLDVLDFLGVPDDGRASFPASNPAMVPRARWLATLFRAHRIREAGRALKGVLPRRAAALAKTSRDSLLRKDRPRPRLRPEFRRQLLAEFREDMRRLETLTGRHGSGGRSDGTDR